MKTHFYFLLAFISLGSLHAQEWQTPVIEGYGEVKYFSEAAVQPDTSLSYNLLFDIKSEATKSGVNKGLWVMARMLNLLSVAGVPTEKIHLVASIHGSATFITLNEEAYQKKYGKPNPNANLIRQLKEHGVDLFVCSQATAARKITSEELDAHITPALSGLSVLSNYQLKGYVLMPN
ncbi:MAG: DsrE family protein [Flavobacteriaceae bacterium]|nr:DsrE family protein [Flavobacteriaceae bacterium]